MLAPIDTCEERAESADTLSALRPSGAHALLVAAHRCSDVQRALIELDHVVTPSASISFKLAG
jgi:hypothetical protein